MVMPQHLSDQAKALIEARLPPGGMLLCLSLTGSRAFGWAPDNVDYDLHGIFAAHDWWDWVHFGRHGFDINLSELEHVRGDIQYRHFEFFQNVSKPVFVLPGFDHQGLMHLCTPGMCNEQQAVREMTLLKRYPHPRAALHCYRLLLVPLHFLHFGTFELNIFTIADGLGYSDLTKGAREARDSYRSGHSKLDLALVEGELETLLAEFQAARSAFKEEQPPDSKGWWREVSKLLGEDCNHALA